MREPRPSPDFDEVLQNIDSGLEKLSKLSAKLARLPRTSDEFRQVVAKIANLEPEPGYELLKNAAIGTHLVGPDGTVLWANECELSALGYDPADYFGKSITEFHMDADVIEHILDTLSGGGELNAYPARLKAADGSIVYVLINSNVYTECAEFAHTRCFTMRVNEDVYRAKACCDLSGCPHRSDGPGQV
jgi:hypothetical protein